MRFYDEVSFSNAVVRFAFESACFLVWGWWRGVDAKAFWPL
jgi:hypothetical protein